MVIFVPPAEMGVVLQTIVHLGQLYNSLSFARQTQQLADGWRQQRDQGMRRRHDNHYLEGGNPRPVELMNSSQRPEAAAS